MDEVVLSLADVEEAMLKVAQRMRGTRFGADIYFEALLDRLKGKVPRWRVSLKGTTQYTFAHSMSSEGALRQGERILGSKDLEIDMAEDFLDTEPPPPNPK